MIRRKSKLNLRNDRKVIPTPPCANCKQLKSVCHSRQIKHRSKRCQILLSYIVDYCSDGKDLLQVAKFLEPKWYVNIGKTSDQKEKICRNILPDIRGYVGEQKGGRYTNRRYNQMLHIF